MKNSLFCLLLFVAYFGGAQSTDLDDSGVPSSIKTYINQTYPAAGKVKYAKEFDAMGTRIVAEFESVKTVYTLKFEDEKLIEELKAVDFETHAVSTKMESAMDQKFGKYKVERSWISTANAVSTYKLIVLCKCNPVALFQVNFDLEGNLIDYTELNKNP